MMKPETKHQWYLIHCFVQSHRRGRNGVEYSLMYCEQQLLSAQCNAIHAGSGGEFALGSLHYSSLKILREERTTLLKDVEVKRRGLFSNLFGEFRRNIYQCIKRHAGILIHCGRVTQICVFTLLLCKTDDANLRF